MQQDPLGGTAEINLRILATTDMHACLTAWDYFAHCTAQGRGLARTASLIATARSEVQNVLLFDNGDFLTGSGLGDYMAKIAPASFAHPMVLAMNALGYDAVNMGNHEFSHGLDHLRHVLGDAEFPLVCTNFDFDSLDFIKKTIILERLVQDSDGQTHSLKIGIMGLLPGQTMIWEAAHLAGHARAHPLISAAQKAAQSLRAQGADVVIALAHTGMANDGGTHGEENSAEQVAELPGIDAVVAGHSHQVFPANRAQSSRQALVLPGHFGSHLGVLDLTLRRNGLGWKKVAHSAELRPIAQRDPKSGRLTPVVADDLEILALSRETHAVIIAQAEQVIGQIPRRLHSYFATIAPSSTLALIAQVHQTALSTALATSEFASLPVLAAVAPFKVGGRGGPENYTDLPPGPFRHHHAADLYMHPNSLVGFRVTGAELALWLERSVSKYSHFPANTHDVVLLNPEFPSFNCDMIYGVSYRIDLSHPPMFDTHGAVINPAARRITDLTYNGQPVGRDQVFAMASNSYRREGQAGFAGTTAAHVIYESPVLLQDLLRGYMQQSSPAPLADPSHWQFLPQMGCTAILQTSPKATEVTREIAHFRPQNLGLNEAGFLRFRLHL